MSAQNRDVEAVVSCGHVFVARTPDMSWMFLFAPAKGTAITKAELNEAIKRATREMDANSVISAVQGRGGSWIPRWDYLSGYWGISIPLWMPFLLFAIPTALLWRRDQIATKRARIGRCPCCGYDRRGLAADSPCPECGTAPKPT